MSSAVVPGARGAWRALAGTTAAVTTAAVLPPARSPLIAAAAWASVALVLAGVGRHRQGRRSPWLLVAAMLAFWAVGTTLVQLQDRVSALTVVVVGAGQAIAVAVSIVLLRTLAPERRRRRAATLDLLVIAVVLALVLVQLVAVALARVPGTPAVPGSGGRSGWTAAVVVPTVDVAITGLLVRVAVVNARLQPAAALGLVAAVGTVLYDLVAQLGGHRLALPGSGDQVLGIGCVLLFGVAALHPTMGLVFDRSVVVRRPPSAALLGLLPLVAVPVGVWSVARAMPVRGLPTAVFLLTGSVVAGLCLVRGAQALRAVEHLAEHDVLTGLPNRRGLERVFADPAPAAGRRLLLVAVDEFKQVNDTHGHDVGDALLLAVRDRLVDAVGSRGVVARLGGDEFVILTASEQSDALAADVQQGMRAAVGVGALSLQLRASIGLANSEDTAHDTLSDLLTCADVAMHAAKSAGRDTLRTFRPRMRAEVARRFTLTAQLRRLLTASATDAGRLQVLYQPLVDLASGAAVGAEALVRWDHPEHGRLAPAHFLGLVHAGGLDHQLDTAVRHTVVTQLAAWRQQGHHPLPVSVNLTRASMEDPLLAGRVLADLAEHAVPPRLLHLEITEHEQLPDEDGVAASLHRLASAGVDVHLDDYGTGYTSLDYLRRYPISLLKLDRSVVCAVRAGDDPLVAGIAAMARTLSVELLAEGVETPEQREHLLGLGIRYGQGWLFHRALSAASYAAVLGSAAARAGQAETPSSVSGTSASLSPKARALRTRST